MANLQQIIPPAEKICTLEQAVERRQQWKTQGITCALTNGCFDILHRGHAEYLLGARGKADKLIVLLNADESVRRLKGPTRPVNNEYDRAYLLGCMSFVDMVVVFSQQRCTKEIEALAPDVYVKGADYTVEKLDPEERTALFSVNAAIEFLPFVPNHSTTETINKINQGKDSK